MSACAAKKQITTKQVIIQMSGLIVGLLLGTFIEKQGFPWIGWGIGGLFISLGGLFAHKTQENRWTKKNISIIILSIIGCSVIYNLIRILEM